MAALTERIKAAFQAFRAPAAKSIPFTSGDGWGGWANWHGTNIDFKREAGSLDNSSLVMAAVNWLGTTLPEAPIQVLQQKAPKVFEPLPDHPMVELLENPNDFDTGEDLWQCWAFSWLIDGNVYFLKYRNALGQVIQLWYEPHFTIRPRWPGDPYGTPIGKADQWILYYEVLRNGLWVRVETEDVIHFKKGKDPNSLRLGLSPFAALLREIFTDNERARFSALILKNGGVIPYLLTPEGDREINAAEVKAEVEYRTTGDNVGKPIVLSGPVKAQQMGTSPEKLLVDKFSQIPEERVAAVIGIPAAVLGFGVGLEQTKIGAVMRELREQAYESFVIPTMRNIQGKLRLQLLPEFGDVKGLKVAHDLSQVRVLQDDRVALFQRETLAYEKGVKTRAEARSALGMDAGPSDDVYYMANSASLIAPEERGGLLAPTPAVTPDLAPQLVNGRAKPEVVN